MTDEAVKKLLSELVGSAKQARRARRNFSVYADAEQFNEFKQACRRQDVAPGEVLDALIALYLSAVKENPGQGEP